MSERFWRRQTRWRQVRPCYQTSNAGSRRRAKTGASQIGGKPSQASRSNRAASIPRSTRRKAPPLTTNHQPLTTAVWAVGPIRPSLVRGLRPRNAPSPTTCLADLVSTFVIGACPRGVRRTTFLQPRQFPVGAGLVPALAHSPTHQRHPTAKHLACTASRQEMANNSSHRWH